MAFLTTVACLAYIAVAVAVIVDRFVLGNPSPMERRRREGWND